MSKNQRPDPGYGAFDFACEQMREGVPGPEVVDLLVEQGVDRDAAARLVRELTEMDVELRRRAALKIMTLGGICCIVGLVGLSISRTYAPDGVAEIVSWGAAIVGAIQFLRGLVLARAA